MFAAMKVLWKALMSEGAHTAGRRAGVCSERPGVRANEQGSRRRWMMDGVDTGGSSPALSRQHKPDLPGWWVGCQPFVYGPPPISHLLYAPKAQITQKQPLPRRSLSLHLWLSSFFIFFANRCYFVFLSLLQMYSKKERKKERALKVSI